MPGGQSVQALALPAEYFPMSHGEQGARPRAPYCPGPHGTRSLLYQATFTPFMAELKTSKAPSPAGTTRATGVVMSRMTRARTVCLPSHPPVGHHYHSQAQCAAQTLRGLFPACWQQPSYSARVSYPQSVACMAVHLKRCAKQPPLAQSHIA